MLINRLLEETKDIWNAYYEHPFIKGIENGTLEKEKFKYYIMQDFLYLIEYTKVFGVGVAKAKSIETMKLFASYIHLLTDGEMDIHKGYMGKFAISEEELRNTPTALDNRSYTSYMLRIAYDGGEAEVLAAILSCAYSYEMIAARIVANHPDAVNHPFYGEWVRGYTDEGYSKANTILIKELDRLTRTYNEEQIKHIVDIFVTCSKYELAFWDMAWEMRQ